MQRSQDWVPATCGAGLTFAIEDADEETLCIVSLNGPADSLRRGRANISAKPCQSRPVGRGSLSAGIMGSKNQRRNGAGAGLGRLRLPAGAARPCSGAPLQKWRLHCADDFDCQHSDLLYIYPSGNGLALQAIYFDNEATSFTMTFPRPSPELWFSSPIPRNLAAIPAEL